ncbi:glycoside hydrolase [Streptomyces sp. NPDC048436]|uniref:glycoside hydrolase n=1 Tax=Streptomyces sp. NPDC048436 TaxID=3365550 RepID=UPI00371D56E2
MPFTRTRSAALGTAVLVAAGLATPPGTAAAAADAAHVTVRLDPSYQQQPFQGWGTALGWFANVTGGWPDAARNRLADDLYGADGLGFTIARYNIGGGDSPETPPYMRAGAAVPGYWNRPAEYGPPADAGEDWKETTDWWDPANPGHWNPKADANQRWWLKAAKQRGAHTFEAFSNSPPYFMTNSGLVSGAQQGDKDNLRPDQYGRFASYLSGALDRVEDSTGVDFDSVSPVNEPNTNYWKAGGRQEGSHWDPASQARMVSTLRDRLDADGLDTPVAAMDETNPQLFRTNWESYSPSVRSDIGRLNTHTYGTSGRPAARDISKGSGIPLWMSEVDLGGSVGQSFTSMSPALDLTKRINDDIKELEPSAWVLWQAVEDYENMTPDRENSNWGLIQTDFTPADATTEPLRKNKKYWAMANYSRFIRPGARVINTDGTGTLAALRPGGRGTTVVHTNATDQAQEVTFDLSGFRDLSTAPVQRYTTDATKNVARGTDLSVDREHKRLTATVAPGSVTTFVLPGATGTDPAAATAPTDAPRHLVNDNSGKSLSAPSDGTSTPVQRTTDAKDAAQEWKFTKVSGSWSSTAAYRVTNVGTGKALSVGSDSKGAAASLVAPASGARQQWMLSTTGGGHYVLVNKATGLVLDMTGAATHDGAPVGVYGPNAGSNQSWTLPRGSGGAS